MHVLVASGSWYPERNGVSRVATETAMALAGIGHQVTALVPRAAGLHTNERRGSLTVRRVLARGHIPLMISDVGQTTRHARSAGSCDVLLAHGSVAAVGLSRARPDVPLVFVFHASRAQELRFARSRLPWGRDRVVSYLNEPIAKMLERTAALRASRVVVLSEFSRSLFADVHPDRADRLRVASGGVDCAVFEPGEGSQAARARLGVSQATSLLLTVRRAEPRMGIEQLLHAMRLLEPTVRLAVVGGGLLEGELQKLATQLGLDGRVWFAGHVSDDELLDWFRAADLFVLPTLAYEGFGMVTVEALASGTPVVGTPIGATPELLEPLDARLIARGTDSASLAAAIEEVLSFVDSRFRDLCRIHARTHFDWSVVIGDWERTLLDAVKQVDDQRHVSGLE